MHNKIKKGLLFFLFIHLISYSAKGEGERIDLGEVVVTASRLPTGFGELGRQLTVIGREEIEDAPVHSIPELLEYASGVDVRRRGVEGIQADVSIRGSTFEETLILMDGIKLSDPQTGHHNMDIPLTLADIERIEVLPGQGSSLYGPNAFGGVINIITRKPEEKKIQGEFILGEHGLSAGNFSLTSPLGKAIHRLSLERKESNGYQSNTEFDISTLSYRASADTSLCPFDFSLGYTDKEFGADSFYSNLYPNEWEETETTLATLRAHLGNDEASFEPKLYWRHHWDKFVLDRTNPSSSVNTHTTGVYGVELNSCLRSSLGKLVLGAELGEETIDSSNLGDHSRRREAVFMEFRPESGDKFQLDLGMRGDHYEGWGWEGNPSASLAYKIKPSLKLRTSVGRSFRVPTYTDLYYRTAANRGNANLKPERAWSYEVGSDYARKGLSCAVTLFRREGRRMIDWVRQSSSDPWDAKNIGEVDTEGLELLFKVRPREFNQSSLFSLVSLGYTHLDSDKKDENNLQSKYVMDYLRHQVFFRLNHSLPLNIYQTWKLSYEDRVGGDNYFLLDTRIWRKLGKVEVFLEGTNLFNTSYEEIAGVSMPGRWMLVGTKIEF